MGSGIKQKTFLFVSQPSQSLQRTVDLKNGEMLHSRFLTVPSNSLIGVPLQI